MLDADPAQAEAMYAARAIANPRRGAVAVVPIHGPLTKRDTRLGAMFGGTSYRHIIGQVDALAADSSIDTIVLSIDSPGGEAVGASEAAAAIRAARESKRVVAHASGQMSSAAAWLGWSASEVSADPDAIVGSQGVFTAHHDLSGAYEKAGIKPTYIGSSDAKIAGRGGNPLDDETRAEMQAIVNGIDGLFKADVAAGRGITVAEVKERYGNGASFGAREAKRRGMVDRIDTFSSALDRIAGIRAADDTAEPEAVADVLPDATLDAVLAELAAAPDLAAAADRLELDGDAWRFGR